MSGSGGSPDIERLIDTMTVREKVAQTTGTFVGEMKREITVSDVKETIRSNGIGFVTPFGNDVTPFDDPPETVSIANELQSVAVEESRLGIPLAIPVDAVHGNAHVSTATVFPHNLALAATGDHSLIERVGAITATEIGASGATLAFGPTCDVARDPRWGRTFETFGESPFVCAELAAAKARGLSGHVDRVGAVTKHFPAYGDPERGEDAAPIDRSRRSIHRDHLRPFEAVLSTGVEGVMPCYNAVNGVPAHASSYWLGDVLRDDLEFDGCVLSDWKALWLLAGDHRIASSAREGILRAIEAGVDVHTVGGAAHITLTSQLVDEGLLSEQRLDEMVRIVLNLKRSLGLFEDPYVDPATVDSAIGNAEHSAVALDAARKSMTLLENRDSTLPFDPRVDSVLLTGPNADDLTHQVGGYSLTEETGLAGETIKDGVEAVVSDETDVRYERGAGIATDASIEPVVDLARDVDRAIVAVGENWYFHEFGPQELAGPNDQFPNRTQLTLSSAQSRLVRRVVETDTPTAVVVVSGRPLALPWTAEHADAVLQAFYPGSHGGRAVAETLFGRVNPGGALPISVPRSVGHLPTRHDHLPQVAPIGHEEHQPAYDPLWEFGHGLSYVSIEVVEFTTSTQTVEPGESVTVSVTLENRAPISGDTVLYIFASREECGIVVPVREVVAFDRVHVRPDQSTTVEFEIPASNFRVYTADGQPEHRPGPVTLLCDGVELDIVVEGC